MLGGKRYAILAVDYFTKWVEAKPVTRHDQKQVYQFMREIFTRFGGAPGASHRQRDAIHSRKDRRSVFGATYRTPGSLSVISLSQCPGRGDEPSNLQGHKKAATRGEEQLGPGAPDGGLVVPDNPETCYGENPLQLGVWIRCPVTAPLGPVGRQIVAAVDKMARYKGKVPRSWNACHLRRYYV
ncbi:hypothetical protein LIER_05754 [Lithospermum erythrorhizon]|uniref:Reverse transcriptase domain-containing protein n=1 Tax=Lithospermum erythrorhizon TaxID=34254 RepID=A0AAV3P1X4_LITER